jgi:hypothetical protein
MKALIQMIVLRYLEKEKLFTYFHIKVFYHSMKDSSYSEYYSLKNLFIFKLIKMNVVLD